MGKRWGSRVGSSEVQGGGEWVKGGVREGPRGVGWWWTVFIQVVQQGPLVYLREEKHDKEEVAQGGRWGVSLQLGCRQLCPACVQLGTEIKDQYWRAVGQRWAHTKKRPQSPGGLQSNKQNGGNVGVSTLCLPP